MRFLAAFGAISAFPERFWWFPVGFMWFPETFGGYLQIKAAQRSVLDPKTDPYHLQTMFSNGKRAAGFPGRAILRPPFSQNDHFASFGPPQKGPRCCHITSKSTSQNVPKMKSKSHHFGGAKNDFFHIGTSFFLLLIFGDM